jgi:hypothetical protein
MPEQYGPSGVDGYRLDEANAAGVAASTGKARPVVEEVRRIEIRIPR